MLGAIPPSSAEPRRRKLLDLTVTIRGALPVVVTVWWITAPLEVALAWCFGSSAHRQLLGSLPQLYPIFAHSDADAPG